MAYPWGHERRFNAYSNYFKKHFGHRVQKLTLDAGFTCPNRDGTKGYGGCTYCNNNAFNPSYCNPRKSIQQQIDEGKEFHKIRYRRAGQYFAYFQAYSNTYAPLEELKKTYEEALSMPDVTGIVIGTRPDCIDQQKLDYLAELSQKYYVMVEYGVESCYNATLYSVNRQHSYEDSVQAIEETHKRGIRTGAHMMFGLPGESIDDMLEEAGVLSLLPLDSVKFHQLQIIRNTRMAEEYLRNPDNFYFFGLEEYLDFIVRFVEQLNPHFVIERIAGEVPPRFQLTEGWGDIRNFQILQKFEKKLEEYDTWQGRLTLKQR